MKKIACIALIFFLFVSPVVVQAQGFVVGFFTGALLFGDGDSPKSGGLSNVLYQLPRVSERVKYPLQIKQVIFNVKLVAPAERHNQVAGEDIGVSLEDLFSKAIIETDRVRKDERKPVLKEGAFEILQVIRFCDQWGYPSIFLFSFIEKGSVIPLDQLPKQ